MILFNFRYIFLIIVIRVSVRIRAEMVFNTTFNNISQSTSKQHNIIKMRCSDYNDDMSTTYKCKIIGHKTKELTTNNYVLQLKYILVYISCHNASCIYCIILNLSSGSHSDLWNTFSFLSVFT